MATAPKRTAREGGRYDFDDGGCFIGQWEDGKAHGYGVCTGPKGQGEYAGAWHYGYEVSGVYIWPTGTVYEGQWQNGKRHGLGVERRGRWIYRGEWSQGFMGRYGVRHCRNSVAKYEGTWLQGLQDGYGSETYADGGVYQGQWSRGMRHGYGIRKSAAYGTAAKMRSRSAAHASLTSIRSDIGDDAGSSAEKTKAQDDCRGGFALRAKSEPPTRRRSLSERSVAMKRSLLQGLRITKQRSTSDIHQRVNSGGPGYSHGGEALLGPDEALDPAVTETYYGEWKNDRRSGYGVSERSDGLKYEGEWYNNRKFGYGTTTFKDGAKEEGKYKNNILVLSQRKKNLLFVRASKLKERIEAATAQATRAAQLALQKADIGSSRTSTARDRAQQAEIASEQSIGDSEVARIEAKRLAPDFHQPGLEMMKRSRLEYGDRSDFLGSPGGSSQSKTLVKVLSNGSSPYASAVNSANLSAQHPSSALRSKSLIIPKHESSDPSSFPDNHHFVPESSGVETPPMETPPDEFQAIHTTIEPPTPSPYQNAQPPPTSFSADLSNRLSNVGESGPGRPPHSAGGPRPTFSLSAEAHSIESPMEDIHAVPNQTMSAKYLPTSQHQPPAPHYGAMNQVPPGTRHNNPPHYGGGGQPPSDATKSAISAMQLRNIRMAGGGGNPDSSPSLSRTPSQSSSRYSLNQIINDHFDQYAIVGNPAQAKYLQQQQEQYRRLYGGGQGGGGGPHYDYSGTTSDSSRASTSADTSQSSSTLQRRSTLAAAKDLTIRSIASPTDYARPRPLGQQDYYGHVAPPLRSRPQNLEILISSLDRSDSKQSLPDAVTLDHSPVFMTREEVSRLSSHRREEVRRVRDENELLRANPLRYIFHPALRDWFARRKLLLFVVAVNVSLTLMFYRLLSYSKSDDDPDHHEPPARPDR